MSILSSYNMPSLAGTGMIGTTERVIRDSIDEVFRTSIITTLPQMVRDNLWRLDIEHVLTGSLLIKLTFYNDISTKTKLPIEFVEAGSTVIDTDDWERFLAECLMVCDIGEDWWTREYPNAFYDPHADQYNLDLGGSQWQPQKAV